MKKIVRTIFTAGLLACVGIANAQESDTTTYGSNAYRQDTTTYEDTDREQQGSDTYNETQNETQYSENDDSLGQPDRSSDERGMGDRSYDQHGTLDRNSGTTQGTNPAQDTSGISGTYGEQGDRSEIYSEPEPVSSHQRESSDVNDAENRSSEYYDRQERVKTENDRDSLETGNEKEDRSEFPETSSSDRGWNQEAGTPPIQNQDTSMHNGTNTTVQEGHDKNNDYHRTGDQSYRDEQPPTNTGIGSQDDIGPDKEEAHRQAREELSTATDTLDYESQRRADPDKVGNRIETMADTVSENMHERDRVKHGLED